MPIPLDVPNLRYWVGEGSEVEGARMGPLHLADDVDECLVDDHLNAHKCMYG